MERAMLNGFGSKKQVSFDDNIVLSLMISRLSCVSIIFLIIFSIFIAERPYECENTTKYRTKHELKRFIEAKTVSVRNWIGIYWYDDSCKATKNGTGKPIKTGSV